MPIGPARIAEPDPGISVNWAILGLGAIAIVVLLVARVVWPALRLASFDFRSFRQIYDTGKFTIAGAPAGDGREATLWALDPDGKLAMTATAKFA